MDSEPADTTKKKPGRFSVLNEGNDPWLSHSLSRNIFILKLSLTKNENYSSEVCSRTSYYLDIVKGEQVYENN